MKTKLAPTAPQPPRLMPFEPPVEVKLRNGETKKVISEKGPSPYVLRGESILDRWTSDGYYIHKMIPCPFDIIAVRHQKGAPMVPVFGREET